jgi:hypothetical protein
MGARLTAIVPLHFCITVATVFLIVILGQLAASFFMCRHLILKVVFSAVGALHIKYGWPFYRLLLFAVNIQ